MAKDRCPWCGHKELIITEMQAGVHHARVTCASCQRFVEWLPKPDSDRTKRPAAHVDLVRKYSKGFCELCGILQNWIPKGEALEAQHVIEYRNGGGNERENIQIVCTSCHKLIHWLRTYKGHLIPGGQDERVGKNTGSTEIAQAVDQLEIDRRWQ